jgi:hypothetical protein
MKRGSTMSNSRSGRTGTSSDGLFDTEAFRLEARERFDVPQVEQHERLARRSQRHQIRSDRPPGSGIDRVHERVQDDRLQLAVAVRFEDLVHCSDRDLSDYRRVERFHLRYRAGALVERVPCADIAELLHGRNRSLNGRKLILDDELLRLRDERHPVLLREPIRVTAAVEDEREVLDDRRRVTRGELGAERLYLLVLCSSLRLYPLNLCFMVCFRFRQGGPAPLFPELVFPHLLAMFGLQRFDQLLVLRLRSRYELADTTRCGR